MKLDIASVLDSLQEIWEKIKKSDEENIAGKSADTLLLTNAIETRLHQRSRDIVEKYWNQAQRETGNANDSMNFLHLVLRGEAGFDEIGNFSKSIKDRRKERLTNTFDSTLEKYGENHPATEFAQALADAGNLLNNGRQRDADDLILSAAINMVHAGRTLKSNYYYIDMMPNYEKDKYLNSAFETLSLYEANSVTEELADWYGSSLFQKEDYGTKLDISIQETFAKTDVASSLAPIINPQTGGLKNDLDPEELAITLITARRSNSWKKDMPIAQLEQNDDGSLSENPMQLYQKAIAALGDLRASYNQNPAFMAFSDNLALELKDSSLRKASDRYEIIDNAKHSRAAKTLNATELENLDKYAEAIQASADTVLSSDQIMDLVIAQDDLNIAGIELPKISEILKNDRGGASKEYQFATNLEKLVGPDIRKEEHSFFLKDFHEYRQAAKKNGSIVFDEGNTLTETLWVTLKDSDNKIAQRNLEKFQKHHSENPEEAALSLVKALYNDAGLDVTNKIIARKLFAPLKTELSNGISIDFAAEEQPLEEDYRDAVNQLVETIQASPHNERTYSEAFDENLEQGIEKYTERKVSMPEPSFETIRDNNVNDNHIETEEPPMPDSIEDYYASQNYQDNAMFEVVNTPINQGASGHAPEDEPGHNEIEDLDIDKMSIFFSLKEKNPDVYNKFISHYAEIQNEHGEEMAKSIFNNFITKQSEKIATPKKEEIRHNDSIEIF